MKKKVSAKKAKSNVKKSTVRVATKSAATPSKHTVSYSFGALGVIPLGDRILLKPIKPETTTSFGLVIPDSAKEKPEQGEVVAVGPGKRTDCGEIIPVAVSVGDKVMFSKYGFDEVKVQGVEYYLVREDSISLILE